MIEGSQMLVQKLRLQRGWSQEQLAEISGLSVRTIQRLERGQNAGVETLKALGAVFDVDFSVLKEPTLTDASTPALSAVTAMSPDEALALAHVRNVRGFYIHVSQYVIVMTFLCVVNWVASPRQLWVIWPALGWGMGLALHGLRIFDKIPFLGADWERRQVEKRLGRKL